MTWDACKSSYLLGSGICKIVMVHKANIIIPDVINWMTSIDTLDSYFLLELLDKMQFNNYDNRSITTIWFKKSVIHPEVS